MTDDWIKQRRLGVVLFRGQEVRRSVLGWRLGTDRMHSIDLDGPDGPLAGSGGDLFQALQEIRLVLEPQGWLIGVQGARKAAYASGMVRDVLGACRVYIVRPGRQVERGDLVDIFAEAAQEDVGTVEQQGVFYREWRRSVSR